MFTFLTGNILYFRRGAIIFNALCSAPL
jgi:hypothetical protein